MRKTEIPIRNGYIMYKDIITFIKELYKNENPVPLHAPKFFGNEKKYLVECIDTTYVSYVGPFVTKFEELTRDFTKSKFAVAIANGTLALHTALILSGVKQNDEVLTQALTFVATANAVSYTGARCVFIDSEKETIGMSPEKLEDFLKKNCLIKKDGYTYNKNTNNRISVCIPMHVFGHPVRIDKIKQICDKYNIILIEDSAESIGSYYKGKHTGTYGKIGILSYNGNKTITTGGGGMIITDDDAIAKRAVHITKTAKVPHQWEFIHDEVGYNYRLSNLNAAVGCAQMEKLEEILKNKRELAGIYKTFFDAKGIEFVAEPDNCVSNYWLNAIILKNKKERDRFLEDTNKNGVSTRPVWRLMNKLAMYKNCESTDLETAEWLADRIVNLPSGLRI
jgi:perosamine synthetase